MSSVAACSAPVRFSTTRIAARWTAPLSDAVSWLLNAIPASSEVVAARAVSRAACRLAATVPSCCNAPCRSSAAVWPRDRTPDSAAVFSWVAAIPASSARSAVNSLDRAAASSAVTVTSAWTAASSTAVAICSLDKTPESEAVICCVAATTASSEAPAVNSLETAAVSAAVKTSVFCMAPCKAVITVMAPGSVISASRPTVTAKALATAASRPRLLLKLARIAPARLDVAVRSF